MPYLDDQQYAREQRWIKATFWMVLLNLLLALFNLTVSLALVRKAHPVISAVPIQLPQQR